MKIFKGKYRKGEEGDRNRKPAGKSFRKTGKNLIMFEPETIFAPRYNRFHLWWD